MQFLRMVFTWWHSQTIGTAIFTWWRGKLVGQDEEGNRYYCDRQKQAINGKVRRWVVFHGDIEASRVPAKWHGWLHYIVDEIPDQMSERKPWQKCHQINMTGTKKAYRKKQTLQKKDKTYQAWNANADDLIKRK